VPFDSVPAMNTLVPYLFGAASTLVVQIAIQLGVVPRVEARKRREDRWERDVRELGELLTTDLAERASAANAEQSAFRYVRQLEDAADADKDKLAHLNSEYSRKARLATAAFNELAHTRVPWLVDRIKAADPRSDEIVRFANAARRHRIRAIVVDDWTENYAPPDLTIEDAWDEEREARSAFVKEVTGLLDLPHPPRASLIYRWRRTVSAVAGAATRPLRASRQSAAALRAR
jgi:hypothetical protein